MKGITEIQEDYLYKEFGINAELLIDHAFGKETCEISDIKNINQNRNQLEVRKSFLATIPIPTRLSFLRRCFKMASMTLLKTDMLPKDFIFLLFMAIQNKMKHTEQ